MDYVPSTVSTTFSKTVFSVRKYAVKACFANPTHTHTELLEIIDDKRIEHKFPAVWKPYLQPGGGGDPKNPPVASMYPKGKSQERAGIIKIRVVISHYGHPSSPE